MKFNAPFFDLEFEGDISTSGIKVTSVRKMSGITASIVVPMNIRTRPSPFRHGGFDIYLDDLITKWYGDYVYRDLAEAMTEIASYCLKQLAFKLHDEVRAHLRLQEAIGALTT